MRSSFYKTYILTALIAVLVFTSIPQEAQARNLFRQFFHDIRRATTFIVKLPDKATRWMGPVLGPIASGLLTQNLAGHHRFGQLFSNIRRANNVIEDVEEQRRLTGEVRQMYRDQATELRNYVSQLEEARETLRTQLIDRDVNMHDYIQTAIELDRMIETVNQTANRFDTSAENLRTQDIVKIAGQNLLNSVVGEIQNVALGELQEEIFDVINPDIIRILTDQDSRGLDALIEMALANERDNYDGEFNWDELKDRVRDRIREMLEDNKNNFEGNLRDEIQSILAELANNMNEESGDLGEQVNELSDGVKDNEAEEVKNPYTDDELVTSLSDIPVDEFGCRPGYEWQRMSGVGCVQSDCRETGAHYSYTKACICGLVDPKPGDKTKSCARPSNYLACPSCVFACVDPDAECPER
ncbi:hypothetical protein C0583_01525 [Candidatus Parcubacteria bacterium]|nr:MAG: hypothetical protein C0583_01525 [Candidatus Parcubacteria bacterium]